MRGFLLVILISLGVSNNIISIGSVHLSLSHVFNDRPVSISDTVSTPEDTPINIAVLANDTDPDGDPITSYDVSLPQHGTILIPNGDTIIYSPDPSYAGRDSFQYAACDPAFSCSVSWVYITVTAVNDPPVAIDDKIITDEEVPVDISILANDSDDDNDTLIIQIIDNVVHGTLFPTGEIYTYTPSTNYVGLDSFRYVICDPEPLCDTAWVQITVNPINDPPQTQSYNIILVEDTINAQILPLINDTDPEGDVIRISTVVSIATTATITIQDDSIIVYTPPADFNGLDTLIYEACDAALCEMDTIFITVLPINDAPLAQQDMVTTDEEVAIDIEVLLNDSDVENDPLIISVFINPMNGSLSNSGEIYTYTPDSNYTGLDSFQYVICDPQPLCDSSWVFITVNPVNDPPEPVKDLVNLTEDTTGATILPLINDFDPDNDTLRIGTISSTAGASISIQGDSILIYSPPLDYFGRDTVFYEACDQFECVTDTICILIDPINDAPNALDDMVSMDEDTTVTIPFLENDSDVDDVVLTYVVLVDPLNGTYYIVNDTLTYTPALDYNGLDSLQYEICDPQGACDTAWVYITINPINDPPQTQSYNIILVEDTINAQILPLINDTDPEGDVIRISTVVSIATTATITIQDDSIIVYTPPADFNGLDTLIYEACDAALCEMDTIFITVLPINDAPLAQQDMVTTDEEVAIDIEVLLNDSDVENDPLIISVFINPMNGSLSNSGEIYTYTPDSNYTGLDSFQYVICDPQPLCDSSWVFITVNPVNDPPEPVKDLVNLTEDTTGATILPLINDFDPDNDTLRIGTISSTAGASISIQGDSILIYSPPLDYFGRDTVFYEACDQFECVTDTICILIDPINDAPNALDDMVSMDEDTTVTIPFLENDSDVDDVVLTYVVLVDPLNGTYYIVNDTLTYTPALDYNGLDSLQYEICDPQGACDTSWINIEVRPINDPPGGYGFVGQPIGDLSICVVEDTTNVEIHPFQIINDVDGDDLIIALFSDPTSMGLVSLQGDTLLIYSPPVDFNGMDSIFITVCDLAGSCIMDTVIITVKPVDDTPIANPDNISVSENDTSTIAITINDSNPDGSTLTISIVSPPVNGTVTIEDPNMRYIPSTEYFGLDSFSYSICTPAGLCDTAIVLIEVQFVNESPVAVNDFVNIVDTSCIHIPILDNDSDPNNDSFIIQILGAGSSNASISPDSTLLYCPPSNYLDSDTIYYAICDTHAIVLCDTAMVVINMTCPTFSHNLTHDALCPNEPFSIVGTEVLDLTNYEWSYPDLLGIITTDPELINFTSDVSNEFILKSARYGCQPQFDTIAVSVRLEVSSPELNNEQMGCENTSVELSIVEPEVDLIYDWYFAATNNQIGTGTTITIDNLDSTTEGTYYTIANDGVCNSSPSNPLDLQILTDLTSPSVEAGEDLSLCQNQAYLDAQPAAINTQWTTPSNAFIVDINDPKSRVYDLDLGENKFYWTQANISCIPNSVDSVSIFYYPEAELERDSFFVPLNETITLDLLANDNLRNIDATTSLVHIFDEVINNGDGSISVNLDGSIKSPLIIAYEVCYDSCPDNCVSEIASIYFESPAQCRVPNVFTPNGDGINDLLDIECINDYPGSEIIIFNRWGDEVYSNYNYDNSWDGTLNDAPLAVGTYFYLFKINDGSESVEKGFIHIDR